MLLVLFSLTGCLSLRVRNPDLFSSRSYLPPWKWIRVERSDPKPKGPHLSLPGDRDYVILSLVRDCAPEQRERTTAELIAPFLHEVESELNAPDLRSLWKDHLGVTLPDEKWPVYKISGDMKFLLWGQTGASPETLQALSRRAYWYACVRLAGFSTVYAVRSQAEGFAHVPEDLPKKIRAALRNHPHIPPRLIRTHTWVCDSGHQHEEFYVLDNGIAWILAPMDVDLGEEEHFWLNPERRDAQEFNPALEEAFASGKRKAEAILKQKGIEGMGSCHAYWGALRTILKEEYGIEWRSPSYLNPQTMYD